MNATQRAILGIGLLIALVLVLLPPWQSTIYTQDKQTRAQLVIGPTPEPRYTAFLSHPPNASCEDHGNDLETWTVWSVNWSRLAALLLADGLACAVLIVLTYHVGRPGEANEEARQEGAQAGMNLGPEGLPARVGGIVGRPGRG